MVRHDHIFLDGYRGIFYGNLLDEYLCDGPERRWDGEPVPYEVAKGILLLIQLGKLEIGVDA